MSGRYHHGDLPQDKILEFLAEWRSQEHVKTKKGAKRGELAQIRSALRAAYPGWQVNLKMLAAALHSVPEWAESTEKLCEERNEKLEMRRERNAARKARAAMSQEAAEAAGTDNVKAKHDRKARRLVGSSKRRADEALLRAKLGSGELNRKDQGQIAQALGHSHFSTADCFSRGG
ncbi:hypothetical protein NM688_g5909 [Phlebia brevispora]|uniref:Uncharacterized protein n=1 Tax=Phlebia brevispora TaxID=194682 RepID=A0ACC1SMR9_9APHY|nr:hypothetical protein NM688_g5909 [Phlebia brevispora]